MFLVGTTATGLRESVATPLAPWVAGLEVHAHAVDNLLRGDALQGLGWPGARLGLALLVLACGAGATTAAILARPAPAAAWVGGAALLGVAWARWSLGSSGVFVAPLLPVAALAANWAVLALATPGSTSCAPRASSAPCARAWPPTPGTGPGWART